jgi:hypothetical protein
LPNQFNSNQLESKKNTKYQMLKKSIQNSFYIPRSLSSLSGLKSMKRNDEFDVVGIVFRIDIVSKFVKHTFITDENNNFLMIEMKETESREITWSVRELECYSFMNLKFNQFDEKFNVLCCDANENSFATQAKYKEEISVLEKYVKLNKHKLNDLEIKKI